MNKLSKRLALAVMTCAAVGLSACQEEKKPEEKPAASTSAPAPEAAKTATPPAAETPAPAPASEPAKPAESSPMTPAAPAPATEPEKKSEAPAAPANEMAATPPAPAAEPMAAATLAPETKSEAPQAPAAEPAAAPPAAAPPAQTAEATPAPAAPEAKPAEANPADAKPADPAAAAAPANPDDIKDRTSPPDPVSELAKRQGIKFEDGRYRNKDGEPQFVVTKDYMVDWGTWNGFRRYHDACHVCHGPNALGSTFAPALAESLKTIDYSTFVATVSGGRVVNRAGTTYVMPSFGQDRNIMCYLDDIYTYIKARSTGAMPPGRPNGREDISPEARKAASDCTG